ncbi:hypothetical protein [Streptomyces sp. 147326]|uniref:hypothetical protein n=1 Tax=Streptomyces sp. 147326 TaxID=3074379 RepID=UPI00385767C5
MLASTGYRVERLRARGADRPEQRARPVHRDRAERLLPLVGERRNVLVLAEGVLMHLDPAGLRVFPGREWVRDHQVMERISLGHRAGAGPFRLFALGAPTNGPIAVTCLPPHTF